MEILKPVQAASSYKVIIVRCVVLLLVAYQVIRLIVFANVYGGVQTDSGQYSAMARSLAERGTYTTMDSTIVDPTVKVGHYGTAGRIDVQDEEGRIWFWTVTGVGPGSIVPNAVILKIFGVSFWTLKIMTFLFVAMFLLLASFFLYYVGGIVSVLLFNVFLIFYPHLLIPLGIEPYGEIATIVYILLAYLLFIKARQTSSHKTIYFFLCGVVCGLTLVTRLIGLFSLLSIFTLWFSLYVWQRYRPDSYPGKQLVFKHILVMGAGLIILPVLWELYKFVALINAADFESYKLFTMARLNFIQNDSTTNGINITGASVGELLLAKLLIVSQISNPNSILSAIMFIVIAVSGPWLIYYHREKTARQNIILLFWLGWLIHTVWFIVLCNRTTVRHDWYALIFGIILFCWLFSYAWQRAKNNPQLKTFSVAGLVTLILLVNLFSQRYAVGFFIPDRVVEVWRLNHLATDTLIGKYEQHMPWILIPRAQQQEAIDFINQLPATSHVYHVGSLHVSELPVLVGRIFYPLQRRPLMPHSDQDVVILNNAFNPWRRPQELVESIKQEIKRQCPQVLLENDYYIICSVTD